MGRAPGLAPGRSGAILWPQEGLAEMSNRPGMVTVYESMLIEHAASVLAALQDEGIAARFQNMGLMTGVHFGAAVWGAPLVEVPEEDAERARAVVARIIAARQELHRRIYQRSRHCPDCGEKSPPNFECCWSCGATLGDGETAESGPGPEDEE